MDVRTAQAVISCEPALGRIDRIEPLRVGFSPDVKFLLFESDMLRCLLRFGAESRVTRQRGEYEVLSRLSAVGSLAPEPVCFGVTDDGSCYTATRYIAGRNAEDVLPALDQDQQYQLGTEAGSALRRLHELTPGAGDTDWISRHQRMFDAGVRAAQEAQINVPGGQAAVAYASKNIDALDAAEPTLMHNDFYPANLIVEDGHLNGIVDFELWDWGDPVHDFHKMTWFAIGTSAPFAVGQVRGYVGGDPTSGFWRRYNLHVAMSLPRMLAFIAHVDRGQLFDWMGRAEEIAATHDFESGGAPTWFQ